MEEFISLVTSEFKSKENLVVALQQKTYMRNQFEFFGLKAVVRREIQKPFLTKVYLPEKEKLHKLIKELWLMEQRDYQLFAQELVFKYVKQFEKKDIELLEFMIITKSWWDTVDFIAYKLVGTYFKMYPNEIETHISVWLTSKNIWLQRTALLFQLKYKDVLDTELLTTIINSVRGGNEFFINKAIGWVLREYSRTNPQWVIEFVAKTELHNLSRREALRLIK